MFIYLININFISTIKNVYHTTICIVENKKLCQNNIINLNTTNSYIHHDLKVKQNLCIA